MKSHFQLATYIMASARNGTVYTGSTSNLVKRAWQHREMLVEGFTSRHNVKILVWFELHTTMENAITRELAIKEWKRKWKLNLIESMNPDWRDLWPDIIGGQAGDPSA